MDPELADELAPHEREEASAMAIARPITVRPGVHEAPAGPERPGLGLLVVEGLLLRDVRLASRIGSELVGNGDVLQPWEDEPASASVPIGSQWRVLEPTRMAVLDREFLARVAPWPQIVETLASRMIKRARSLSSLLLISRLPRVEARVLVLFSYLCDRWGRVGPKGIELPLDLTHDVIAGLVGAQRPTVTTALGSLAHAGAVQRREGGWLLQPDPLRQLDHFTGGEPARRWSDVAI